MLKNTTEQIRFKTSRPGLETKGKTASAQTLYSNLSTEMSDFCRAALQQEDESLVSWPWKEKAKPYPPRILSSVFFSWHLAEWISEFRLIT